MTKIFYENIDDKTLENNLYREVLYTSKNQQFVVMSINPNDNIKMEVHKDHDQFIKIDKGMGIAIVDGTEYKLFEGIGIIIPAGTKHEIINSGIEKLKLYTIYSPPEHDNGEKDVNNPDKSINKLKESETDLNKSDYKDNYLKYKNKYLKKKYQIL